MGVLYSDILRITTGFLVTVRVGDNSYLHLAVTVYVVFFFIFPSFMCMTTYKWQYWATFWLTIIQFISACISHQNDALTSTSAVSYRAIYVFCTLFSDVVNLPLIFFKFTVIVTISITFTLCLIYGVSLVSLGFCVVSVFVILVNLGFFYASAIYESSEEFSYKWKQTKTSLLARKVLPSLRACRIYAGSQYFVDRGVLPKVNSAVI